MNASKVTRMREAVERIEGALKRDGITVDAHRREAIGLQLAAYVDKAGQSTVEAVSVLHLSHATNRFLIARF